MSVCVCAYVRVCVYEAMSNCERGVEREDQSGGRMSSTLSTAHTGGAVQTQPPPQQADSSFLCRGVDNIWKVFFSSQVRKTRCCVTSSESEEVALVR